MDDERSLGPKETGSQAAAPIFIAYMKEVLKGTPVEQFPGFSSTVLATRDQEEADDEMPSQAEETYYPEEEVVKERTQAPQATSQQFFKNDLD
jgi:penicillin-binding protein 1A